MYSAHSSLLSSTPAPVAGPEHPQTVAMPEHPQAGPASVNLVDQNRTRLHELIRAWLSPSTGLHVRNQQGVYFAPGALKHAELFLNTKTDTKTDTETDTETDLAWHDYVKASVISTVNFDLDLASIGVGEHCFHVPTADLFFGEGGEAYRKVVNGDLNYIPFYKACQQNYAAALQSSFKIGASLSSVGSIVMVGPSAEELQLLLMSLSILQKLDDHYQSPEVYLCSQCPQELNSVLKVLITPQEVTYNGGVPFSIPATHLAKFNAIVGDITQIQFLNPNDAFQPNADRLSLECNLPSYHFYKGLTFGNFSEEEVRRLCGNVYGSGRVYFDGQENVGIDGALVAYASYGAKQFVSTVPAMILNKMGVPNDLLVSLPLHVQVNVVNAKDEDTNKYARTIVHTISLPDAILNIVRKNYPDFPRDMIVSRSTRRDLEVFSDVLNQWGFNVSPHIVPNDYNIYGVTVSKK